MNLDAMTTGRFYYNGDIGVTLEERVRRAFNMYVEKVGVMPNRVHVNPKIVNSDCVVMVKNHPVKVIVDSTILEHIVWIGEGKEDEQ